MAWSFHESDRSLKTALLAKWYHLRGVRVFIIRDGLGYPPSPLKPLGPFWKRLGQVFELWRRA